MVDTNSIHSHHLYARNDQLLYDHAAAVSRAMSLACALIGFSKLAGLTGWIHDLGKALRRWQIWCKGGFQGDSIPHAPLGARWILRRTSGGDHETQLVGQMVAILVYGHHSGLPDVLTPDGESFESRLFKDGNAASEDKALEEAAEAFFGDVISLDEADAFINDAAEEIRVFEAANKHAFLAASNKDSARDEISLHFYFIMRFMYSALIDADWYSAGNPDVIDIDSVFCMPSYPWADYLQALEASTKIKNELALAGSSDARVISINNARQVLSDACQQYGLGDTSTLTLEAKTGAGKTLSTARLAMTSCASGRNVRFIVVVPYLTVAEQTADEIREAVNDQDGSIVLEHHSDVILESDEEYESYLSSTERWDYPIIVTSLVQFMNTLFSSSKQAARRMHMLCDSVIVFDEVQMVPDSCIYLFNVAVNFLTESCGCRVVLSSATQPRLDKVERFPLRLEPNHEIADDAILDPSLFKRTRILDSRREPCYSASDIVDFIESALPENNSILTIMNTKAAAKRIYREAQERLGASCDIYYLTTELCPAHRRKTIAHIKAGLDSLERNASNCKEGVGSSSEKCRPIICVSTQLVEAGVDFSFSEVLRSVAGVPSIIQSAGRCNRSGEMGAVRDVHIIDSEDENLSHLRDIAKTVDATTNTIAALFPDSRDGNTILELEAPACLDRYYGRLRKELPNPMGYRIKQGAGFSTSDLNAIDLISFNKTARKNYQGRMGKGFSWEMAQSFRTVNKSFHVIDNDAIGVIVPFEDGEDIAEELMRAVPCRHTSFLLRKAQPYTVNLYQYQLERLIQNGAIIYVQALSIFILNTHYYDAREGVLLDKEFDSDDYIV